MYTWPLGVLPPVQCCEVKTFGGQGSLQHAINILQHCSIAVMQCCSAVAQYGHIIPCSNGTAWLENAWLGDIGNSLNWRGRAPARKTEPGWESGTPWKHKKTATLAANIFLIAQWACKVLS